jgi:hypothetical protein
MVSSGTPRIDPFRGQRVDRSSPAFRGGRSRASLAATYQVVAIVSPAAMDQSSGSTSRAGVLSRL